MSIFIPTLVFWNLKPKSSFWENLSQKIELSTLRGSGHRVSWGCDCKDTEGGLEAKIKIKAINEKNIAYIRL